MLFPLAALWQYQFVANDLPLDLDAVVPPAAGWLGPSPAPFGHNGNYVTEETIGTAWALYSGLWVRRALVVDGRAAVTLRGVISNSCFVYLNGALVGSANIGNALQDDPLPFEIVLPKALVPAGVHTIAILCLDEGWLGSNNVWFSCSADYLPAVMPFWAGPPVGEVIEWLNDVTIYENGAEDREQLRVSPRHQYRFSCYVPPIDQPLAENLLYGARASQWIVPVWPQGQHLGGVAAGGFTLDALTSYSEFAPGSIAILWESTRKWQVVGVDRIPDANHLALSTRTQAFTDAWLFPAHRAFLENDPGRSFNGRNSRLALSFNVEDNRSLTVGAPAQYLGADIYYDEGLLDGLTSTENITTQFDLIDETLGLVSYSSPWLHNRPARVHRMMGEDQAEAWAIRQWLHRRQGRLNPFWQPSFENDLTMLNVGLVGTTLSVSPDDYERWANQRAHLAIETTTGWLPRAVVGAVEVSDSELQLTLSATINRDASEILRISFLGLRRLNSDRAEFNWLSGTACVCAVPVIDIAP